MNESLVAAPIDAGLMAKIGDSLSDAGQGAQAVSRQKRAIVLNPCFPGCYLLPLGQAPFHLDDGQKTIKTLSNMRDKPKAPHAEASCLGQVEPRSSAHIEHGRRKDADNIGSGARLMPHQSCRESGYRVADGPVRICSMVMAGVIALGSRRRSRSAKLPAAFARAKASGKASFEVTTSP